MTAQLHASDDLLIRYARADLDPAEVILVAVHLTSCPFCRRRLASFEAMAAMELGAHAAVPPIDALLARLDEPEPARAPLHPDLPRPLAHVELGPWRWLAPWTRGRYVRVDTGGRLPLTLLEMSAGARLHHVDGGRERAAVLRGGWTDQHGTVGPGDLVWTEPHVGVHEQVIDPGEPCLALVLNDARATPTGPFRALGRWFRA